MATEDPFTTTLRSAQLQARNFLSAWVDVDAYGLLRAIPSMRADTRLHEPSDADYPIYRTAHVYSKQQTVWDLLDGSLFATALPKQVFQRIAPSAWEVLEIVIEAWEVDADQHGTCTLTSSDAMLTGVAQSARATCTGRRSSTDRFARTRTSRWRSLLSSLPSRPTPSPSPRPWTSNAVAAPLCVC